MPVTRTPWRSCAIASAIAPLPVPDVEHALAVLGEVDQQLGLRPRHQHAVVDHQLELAEVRAAEDVGDRLAAHAAAHHVVERQRLLHVEPALRIGVQRRPVDAEHARPAAPRRRAAACRRRRPRASRPPRRVRRAAVRWPAPASAGQAAWASSLRRRSSADSASVNSSSSPSSTASRLWAVSLMRWSVTRPCGIVVGAHLLRALAACRPGRGGRRPAPPAARAARARRAARAAPASRARGSGAATSRPASRRPGRSACA